MSSTTITPQIEKLIFFQVAVGFANGLDIAELGTLEEHLKSIQK